MQRIATYFALFGLSLLAFDALGQGIAPYLEYRKRIEAVQNITPLDNGLFGDKVSNYDGSTHFSVTDIDIPGNNGMPVKLVRYLSVETQPQSMISTVYDTRLRGIGNWNVDVPYMAATYPSQASWSAQRCSAGVVPDYMIGYFRKDEYWFGVTVHLPERGNTSVLGLYPDVPHPSSGGPYRLATVERDVFDCIPMQSGLSGEGFRMTTTEGLRYYFDVAVSRNAGILKKQLTDNVGVMIPMTLPRTHYYLLASKVEDRFGNTLQYQYNSNGHATRIWSSDGREIVLAYANGKLSSATGHGRTWQYQYDANGDLATVNLPDGSQWRYAYTGTLLPRVPSFPELEGEWVWCSPEQGVASNNYRLQVTHPSGATGLFQFLNSRHYRSGVHATSCIQEFYDNSGPGPGGGVTPTPTYSLVVPNYFDVMSLTSKVISGPGTAAMTWQYDYGTDPIPLWGSHTQPATYPCTTCTQFKTVTVTNPDGTKLRQRYGVLYWVNEGRLLQSEALDANGAVVRTEVTEYMADADANNQALYTDYGALLGGVSSPSVAWVRPVVKRTTTQQGRSFKWEVDKTCIVGSTTTYCFDAYARPTKVTRSSSP
ncbi:MAG: hypothetical protein QM769_08560 [Pseudoxanthomonas sp.]